MGFSIPGLLPALKPILAKGLKIIFGFLKFMAADAMVDMIVNSFTDGDEVNDEVKKQLNKALLPLQRAATG
jgi:hypothetical protein